MDFDEGVVLITVAPLYLEIKRFVTWLWADDIITSLGRVPNEAPRMKFSCCLNLMFLASLWLDIHRLSNWSFCWLLAVQNWYLFCWLWASRNWPYSFVLDRSVILLSLGKILGREKQTHTVWQKSSRTMHKIWHKSFSMIQSVGIKNWVLQSINRQMFSLLFLFVTRFLFLRQNKICLLRTKIQQVLRNWGNIFLIATFFDSIAKGYI